MKTAQVISVIGHPIFHPTLMLLILVLTGFKTGTENILLGITFLTTCLIPTIILVMMQRWHVISSLNMEDREERLAPLFIMVLFLYTALKFFGNLHIPSYTSYYLIYFNFYLITAIVVTALAFITTFFWKISLHTLGWGNLTACLFIMTAKSMEAYLLYFIGSIVITGIVAAARLKQESHSNAQIYTGFAMGFATVIIISLLF